MKYKTDYLLAQRWAKWRDNAAFETIWNKMKPLTYSHGLKFSGSSQDAEDITQETALTLVRKLGQYEGRCALSTYCYRITHNICLMRHRRNLAIEEELLAELPDYPIDPDPRLRARDNLREGIRALNKLNCKGRPILALRLLQNMSNVEIARISKRTIPAVKSDIHRARMKLRQNLINRGMNIDDFRILAINGK